MLRRIVLDRLPLRLKGRGKVRDWGGWEAKLAGKGSTEEYRGWA